MFPGNFAPLHIILTGTKNLTVRRSEPTVGVQFLAGKIDQNPLEINSFVTKKLAWVEG
jgi:hypothetical protein